MPAQLTHGQQHQVFLKARDLGLVEMNWDGGWKLTRDGRDFIDMFDALRSIDDRPPAVPDSSPRRQAPPARQGRSATRPTGSRQGDDDRTARAAQRNRT